ncbi:MAG TPA: peptidoglycan DD-metalloendopeptidase family protein [Rhodocyclaceae bacterium]|nr:peptidoglycan DD-metalloendopeptidase family protein [Rhodocyclaceae bacterium]
MFIRAGGGEDVVAVAPGEVVFSDWLRGYGNLIIVDHGDDYLTIYGNNDALFKVVGDRIGGGTPIASVGASGGAQESGLYFEIRHKGEPVDPMQWIRAR